MEAIISSIIAGGMALIGVIFTNAQGSKQIENKLSTTQAVIDTKLQSLTEEVKRHNDYWMKIPVIEHRIEELEQKLKGERRRVDIDE